MQSISLDVEVGEIIKNRLRAAGISQETVAEQIGRTQQAVSRRITGDVEFSASELRILADLLDTTVDALLSPTSSGDAA